MTVQVCGAGGVRLACDTSGEGPAILLCHSWGQTRAMWRHQTEGLVAAGFKVVTYDRRGHDGSGSGSTDYALDTLADDLAAVIEQRRLSDLTLVGHSMAAAEIVRYLTRHGTTRVRAVALLAPTTPCVRQSAGNPLGIDPAIIDGNLARIATDLPAWAAENAAPYLRPETPLATRDWTVSLLLGTPVPVLVACMRAFTDADQRAELRRLRLPFLVVHGDRDVSAPLAVTGEPTAALVAGARLVVLAGAPHGLHETDARRVNAELVALARHGWAS